MNEKESFLVLARITEYLFLLFFQTISLMLQDRSFINCFFCLLAEFQINQQLKIQEANGKCCSSLLSLMKTVSVSELIALHICGRCICFKTLIAAHYLNILVNSELHILI